MYEVPRMVTGQPERSVQQSSVSLSLTEFLVTLRHFVKLKVPTSIGYYLYLFDMEEQDWLLGYTLYTSKHMHGLLGSFHSI